MKQRRSALLLPALVFALACLPALTAEKSASVRRARIACMPATFAPELDQELKVKASAGLDVSGDINLKAAFSSQAEAKWESPGFTFALVEGPLGTKRFDVLERTSLEAVTKEIDFGKTSYADPSAVVRAGKAVNADYLLLPTIMQREITFDKKEIPYTGKESFRLRGKLIVQARIVDVATTKIITAFTENVAIEKILKIGETLDNTMAASFMSDLYRVAANRAAHRTIGSTYPVRLLEVMGNKAVLNLGQPLVSAGDVYEVVAAKKGYTDPSTREAMSSEEVLGKIKITKVMDAVSEGEITDGAARIGSRIAECLCRETEESIKAKITLPKELKYW